MMREDTSEGERIGKRNGDEGSLGKVDGLLN